MNRPQILLGITGGIAAYKSAELIRKLKEAGASVRVVMTEAAKAFVTPLTLQALSEEPIFDTLLDEKAEEAMGHIALARWADKILVAPASADFIARLAHGHANDLLTTLCLATEAPIYLAPAMNRVMWEKTVTQANIALLLERGMQCWGPDEGLQACGDTGLGRMRDPESLAKQLMKEKLMDSVSTEKKLILKGKTVLITAGPTQEAIDPVRYITNKSSGKMGYALAEAAQAAGAEVILVTGPVNQVCSSQIKQLSVKTAEEMLEKVMFAIHEVDIFIGTAAVADYRVEDVKPHKIKKLAESLDLHLVKNPDIVSTVTHLPQPPFVVGFAAETQNILDAAREKLVAKKADLIIVNDVSRSDIGFDADENEVVVIAKSDEKKFPLMSKKHLAEQLIEFITEKYYEKNPT